MRHMDISQDVNTSSQCILYTIIDDDDHDNNNNNL